MGVLKEVRDIVRAMGAVFGDIGTSPIYTLTVLMLLTKPEKDQMIGLVSLILWTLILLVTMQYAWLAMNLSIKGEGGIVVLGEIAKALTKNQSLRKLYRAFILVGLSFLMGDGVITPAITILSSSEGIRLIPGFENTPQWEIILIATIITIALFSLQSKGTGKIGSLFGPIIVLWFTSVGIVGLYHIFYMPQVIKALSPIYAVEFLISNPVKGFIALSEVILAATGGEALYADMGHLGRVSIRRAWVFVFLMLTLNYLGQAAFVMLNTSVEGQSVFFAAAKAVVGDIFYIPFLLLVIMAGVIASQALISGVFSIVFQAINTRIAPLLKVKHTSTEISTQIYIPAVNWALMFGVLLMYFNFKTSENMAAAYGFAVITTMSITGIFLTLIYFLKRLYLHSFTALLLLIVDLTFWLSSTTKIPHGAYWSIIFSMLPLSIMILYIKGQTKLYKKMDFKPFKDFVIEFEDIYKRSPKIEGTAIFLIRDLKFIPPYVIQTVFDQGIIYKDNVFLSLIKKDEPFGTDTFVKGSIADGLRLVEIRYGYMEVLDIDKELSKAGIREKVIFYGIEHIYTDNILWKIFSWIKRSSPSFVEFYRFPHKKLHGVAVRVEL
ncbi:MAG: KUP/HAK/KT family potassium transporter [Aquificaceae bacterium]